MATDEVARVARRLEQGPCAHLVAVDPIAVTDIQKIIEQLRNRAIGVIITDHNVRETLRICDRAYIIKDGGILKQGTPEAIAEDPTVREVYLGEHFRLH